MDRGSRKGWFLFVIGASSLLFGASLWGQERDIAALADEMESRVEASLRKYEALQDGIAESKIPLLEQINELENETIELRALLKAKGSEEKKALDELRERQMRIADTRTQNDYVSGLFAQYLNTFEGRLQIAEDQLFSPKLTPLREAIEVAGPGTEAAIEKRAEAVSICLDRLELIMGGYVFPGEAIDSTGEILDGDIVVFGPAAYFRSRSGDSVGMLNYRSGALEPGLVSFEGEYGVPLRDFFGSGSASLPLDASLGKAISLKEASDSWQEHLEKGGYVGYAILAMGGLALFLASVKLIDFAALRVSIPSNLARVASKAVEGELEAAKTEAAQSRPWMRDMLEEGASHAQRDRELMEDYMVSVILKEKPRLERFLPWLAVTAAATPLMGLLGTVVGMIKTFTLITIFGSGDPKALSSGISEALVTTELGLIVAIPTLIIHGALLRLAKKRIGAMELAATEFSKIVSKLAK
jgi:biopolymer transport protein ExbB